MPAENLFDLPIRRADDGQTTLAEHRGKVLLIVNVASRCGLTAQYDALEKLHERYAGHGFSVLGFPANNFAGQEPGSDAEIQEFCRTTLGVKFPVYGKLSVKGPEQHPLYADLTRRQPGAFKKGNPALTLFRKLMHGSSYTGEPGEVQWNFEKFLLGRDGALVARFSPDVKPDASAVIEAIEREVAKLAC